MYLSLGLGGRRPFVVDRLAAPIAGIAAGGRLGDPKNQLQELTARLGLSLPSYKVARHAGPTTPRSSGRGDRRRGQPLGRGTGPSKKHAERVAAVAALELLVGPRRATAPAA